MDIEEAVDKAIKNALSSLVITARLDDDDDLEISLNLDGHEICQTCVELDKVFLKVYP